MRPNKPLFDKHANTCQHIGRFIHTVVNIDYYIPDCLRLCQGADRRKERIYFRRMF